MHLISRYQHRVVCAFYVIAISIASNLNLFVFFLMKHPLCSHISVCVVLLQGCAYKCGRPVRMLMLLIPCIITSLSKTEQESLAKKEHLVPISDTERVYTHPPSWVVISQQQKENNCQLQVKRQKLEQLLKNH